MSREFFPANRTRCQVKQNCGRRRTMLRVSYQERRSISTSLTYSERGDKERDRDREWRERERQRVEIERERHLPTNETPWTRWTCTLDSILFFYFLVYQPMLPRIYEDKAPKSILCADDILARHHMTMVEMQAIINRITSTATTARSVALVADEPLLPAAVPPEALGVTLVSHCTPVKPLAHTQDAAVSAAHSARPTIHTRIGCTRRGTGGDTRLALHTREASGTHTQEEGEHNP